MSDPYAHLNRAHRELVDSPWGTPRGPGHRLRAQWQERRPPRHLVAGALPDERLRRRLRAWCGLGAAACLAALAWLLWPLLP